MHGPVHARAPATPFVAACAPAQSRGARARASGRAAVAALVLVLAPVCGAQQAEPFRIRNLNPLVSIFGLPAWDLVTPGNRFDATVEVANHYRLSARGNETLALDGETVSVFWLKAASAPAKTRSIWLLSVGS